MSATAEQESADTRVNVPLGTDRLNLPNTVTLSRLLLAIGLWVLIILGDWPWVAAVVFVVAAATDFLDGYFARRYGQVTVLGRILDPFADKIVILGTLIFLMSVPNSGVAAWMVVVILARELFVTGLRSFLEAEGVDFSAATAGKAKMASQCIAVGGSLVAIALFQSGNSADWIAWTRDLLLYGTVLLTVYSGGEYTVRGFRLLGQHRRRSE